MYQYLHVSVTHSHCMLGGDAQVKQLLERGYNVSPAIKFLCSPLSNLHCAHGSCLVSATKLYTH